MHQLIGRFTLFEMLSFCLLRSNSTTTIQGRAERSGLLKNQDGASYHCEGASWYRFNGVPHRQRGNSHGHNPNSKSELALFVRNDTTVAADHRNNCQEIVECEGGVVRVLVVRSLVLSLNYGFLCSQMSGDSTCCFWRGRWRRSTNLASPFPPLTLLPFRLRLAYLDGELRLTPRSYHKLIQ